MADIIIAGFGGQGILTAGKILIDVAARQGKNVSWTSSYGAEMRGGTASCSVVISDEEIGSPYPSKLDILLAMNDPSYGKFISQMRPGGVALVNTSLVSPQNPPEGVQVYGVAATDMANAAGNGRAANLVMLGALIKVTGLMDDQAFREGLESFFGKKGHANPANLECYRQGFENVSKL